MGTKRSLAILVSSGFLTGFAPFASGTVGSLAACVAWYLLCELFPALTGPNGIALVLSAITIVTIVGTWSTAIALQAMRDEHFVEVLAARFRLRLTGGRKANDPSFVVIDEWAGMLVSLIGLQHESIYAVASAFLLFRFFDVVKLGPVKWLERLPGAWGVMSDDLLAGALASAVMHTVVLHVLPAP